MTIGERIRKSREQKRMTQEELGAFCGTTKQTIFKYEAGLVTNIPLDRIDKLATVLGTTPAYLMGWEDSARLGGAKRILKREVKQHPSMPSGERIAYLCEVAGYSDEEIDDLFFAEIEPWLKDDFDKWIRIYQLPASYLVDEVLKILHMTPEELLDAEEMPFYRSKDYDGGISFPPYIEAESGDQIEEWTEPEYPGVSRLAPMRRTPLLGLIACGEPILAEENIEDYVDLPKRITADFALECKGDSMIGAGIQDGDVVYIRQQPEVENGQIAAVLVGDDEATLKRFYYDGTTVQLVAENPKFAPMVFTGEDINKVRVIGRAVAFTHSLA